jgi:hypothetical protein
MKRRSWTRSERDGIKPVPDTIPPYRRWCVDNDLDPESEKAWEKWAKKYSIEDYLP